MRGFFGVGVEGVSKPMNAGSIFRSAHAFGASFVFTVAAVYDKKIGDRSDTSRTGGQIPFYSFPDRDSMILPQHCRLVGVELTDDAVELPSFHHPQTAAYILGPERGSLSPEMTARCDDIVKIPTKFCVNVGIAAAVVMYDRVMSLGRFPARALHAGAKPIPLDEHIHGMPILRKLRRFEKQPPEGYETYGEDE